MTKALERLKREEFEHETQNNCSIDESDCPGALRHVLFPAGARTGKEIRGIP
jgi:hypothetical protein